MPKELVGKFRRNTHFKVEYPTLTSIKVQPIEATLTQRQKKHDVMVFEYHSTSTKNAKLLKTGVPVKFTWKQGTRKAEWLGYVSSVQRKGGAQQGKPMKVYCVGSSYVLKQKKTKTYKNKTVTEVAAKIAKENGLRFVGENDTRRFPHLSISGHSQWEWLHEQANRIGYAMYVKGTDLVFRPIDKLLDEQATDTALFQLWDPSVPRMLNQIDRTLDKLDVMTGENMEDGEFTRGIKQVGGVDPVSGKSFTARKSPTNTGSALRVNVSASLFDDFSQGHVAHSKKDAKHAAEASAHLARFNLPAKAYGQGDPRVRPYQLVYVEGSGVQTDGYWLVKEAIHKFVFGGSYSIEMHLATDGTEENRKTATRRSDKALVSQVNLTQLLAKNNNFSVSDNSFTVNLALELDNSNGAFQGISPSGITTGTSRLVQKAPFLTNVGNQGLTRTPTTWQTNIPSSSRISRKCGCC